MKARAIIVAAVVAVAPTVGLAGTSGAATVATVVPFHSGATDGCTYDNPLLVITELTGTICFAQPGAFPAGTTSSGSTAGLWPATYGTEEFGTLNGARVWFHEYADNAGWADCYAGGAVAAFSIVGRDQAPGNIQLTSNLTPCP